MGWLNGRLAAKATVLTSSCESGGSIDTGISNERSRLDERSDESNRWTDPGQRVLPMPARKGSLLVDPIANLHGWVNVVGVVVLDCEFIVVASVIGPLATSD